MFGLKVLMKSGQIFQHAAQYMLPLWMIVTGKHDIQVSFTKKTITNNKEH